MQRVNNVGWASLLFTRDTCVELHHPSPAHMSSFTTLHWARASSFTALLLCTGAQTSKLHHFAQERNCQFPECRTGTLHRIALVHMCRASPLFTSAHEQSFAAVYLRVGFKLRLVPAGLEMQSKRGNLISWLGGLRNLGWPFDMPFAYFPNNWVLIVTWAHAWHFCGSLQKYQMVD